MGRPITCDAHGGDHLADVMVTQLDNGNVQAYCTDAFAELVLAMASAMVEAEAQQAAAEAEAKLAEARTDEPATGTTKVVRRGTSKSRQAHEARKRAKDQPAEQDPDDDPRLMAETPLGDQIDGGAEIAGD